MPVFAEIALVVTLCAPGSAATPGSDCHDRIPESWASVSVVEASQDWKACKGLEAVYLLRPGVTGANCRYSRWGSVANE